MARPAVRRGFPVPLFIGKSFHDDDFDETDLSIRQLKRNVFPHKESSIVHSLIADPAS